MDEPLELDESRAADGSSVVAGLWAEKTILPTVHEVVEKLAVDMAIRAHLRVREAGVFHLALSGGSTPQALYRHLIIDPRLRLFPWQCTHLWLVDDRCVPADDDRSNAKMIREYIADHCDIPAEQVHAMPVLEQGGDAAYDRQLREALAADKCGGRLDYVLLGMGGDAHTASLFPRTPALAERDRWTVFNDGDTIAAPRPRMTLTYPAINAARRIAVLVTGAGKFEALRQVAQLGGEVQDVQRLPISGVRPQQKDTEMTWYLDHGAAFGRE